LLGNEKNLKLTEEEVTEIAISLAFMVIDAKEDPHVKKRLLRLPLM